MTRAACAVLVALLTLGGCTWDGGNPHAVRPASGPVTPSVRHQATEPTSSTSPDPGGRAAPQTAPLPTTDPYGRLARALASRGVDIWFETDLVASWLAGPASFEATVSRLGQLSQIRGVVGFKVADELGYGDGLTTVPQAKAFLRAADRAAARVAPGKQLLVDAVVPELGCMPWRGDAGRLCAAQARRAYPAASVSAMDRYLRSGLVDRLDLSTGLLSFSTYAGWGLTLEQAQRKIWAHVDARGWPSMTVLQARKALADAGGYQGTATEAAADVDTYVDAPVAAGARAVDIWTWRQPYDGQTVSLLDQALDPNPLWADLRAERQGGVRLFTHMTPSQMPTDPLHRAGECDAAASVFSAVFVAAGTG